MYATKQLRFLPVRPDIPCEMFLDNKYSKCFMPDYNSIVCLLSINIIMSKQVATISPCTCKLGHARVRQSVLLTISPMDCSGEHMEVFTSSLFSSSIFYLFTQNSLHSQNTVSCVYNVGNHRSTIV